MPTRRAALLGLAALPAAILAAPAFAGAPRWYAEGGVAIDGSDAVAYFAGKGPVAGKPSIKLDWDGATWYFASAENRAEFEADPDLFAPQYGGYCAFAVSRGYTASTVPEAWSIVDGKLYLNYSLGVRRQWEKDVPGNIAKGDANWPGLISS